MSIDLEIQTNRTVNVVFFFQESLGALICGGTRLADFDHSYFDVTSIDEHFIITNEQIPNAVYYYYIEPSPTHERVRVTMRYTILVDFDGDGLYGEQDDDPFVNETWSSNISDRIEYLENASGNIWTLQDGLIGLRYNFTQFKGAVDDEFDTVRSTIQFNLEYLLDINDNVLNLHLDLEDGIHTYYDSVNLSLFEMRTELTGLEEEIASVEAGSQKELQRLNDRLDQLDEMLLGVEQRLLNLEVVQEEQFYELRADIDNLDIRESTNSLQTALGQYYSGDTDKA